MIKLLSRRFRKCFGGVTMLTLQEFSETGRFKKSSSDVFCNPQFGTWRSFFLKKGLKFDVEFKKLAKNPDRIFASYILEFE